MTAKPQSAEARIRHARGRKLAAAKRSLKQVRDTADQHDEDFRAGRIPSSSFLGSAGKYEQALSELALLDALADGDADGHSDGGIPYGDGVSEPMRADIALLVQAILADPQVTGIEPDSALGRLAAVAQVNAS